MAKSTKSKAKTMSSKDMKKTRGGVAAKLVAADQSMVGSLDRTMAGPIMKEPPTMQVPKPKAP